MSQVRRLKQVYISEILQNQATGDAVQTLRPLLIKLFGNENYAQDQILHPNSIEGQIQTLTEMISSYQKRKTELNHKQHLIQMAYIKALNQLDGYKSPKKITAISIKGLLHQPLEKLIEQIQDPQQGPLISKVLQYTFSKWEDLWNMHIQEYHMKNQNPFL